MAFGRGHSALSFNITRKRVIDFNKLGKISVEALNKAWEEIAHRIKTYAEQEAPVYTWQPSPFRLLNNNWRVEKKYRNNGIHG